MIHVCYYIKYVLESFTETRSTEYVSQPYMGKDKTHIWLSQSIYISLCLYFKRTSDNQQRNAATTTMGYYGPACSHVQGRGSTHRDSQYSSSRGTFE